ncbi:MAG: response regulator [Deltaproteobacteria bacterium]|nr:response regulator [Deltaproteobacteria bacterium]MBW2047889.1 response regulator [Deltaproteobacteria bacterium]MBW2354359.1 response regulator [Deltaproteobacteria bacterium]HDZ91294.1 response regulator [Deltaproteobacteria bacterium]
MAKKIKVLMVDDEEQFRATTSKILTRRGYETTVAESGEEAVEVLKKSPQDVVILDIRMPGMDGHEALAHIKKIDPDVQVIMLTGHGGGESARESLEHGAFDYLNKPCDIELLSLKINDAYDAAREGFREEKRAGDIMIPIEEYTTIDPDSTIKEGIERLKRSFESAVSTSRIMETGHRSILVFEQTGELVGILSILDLIEAVRPAYLSAPKPSMADSMQYSPMFWSGLFTTQAKGLVDKKIREVMSDAPLSIDQDTNLMEIANLIFTAKSRRTAVTREGKVVGVVREQELFFEMAKIILKA